MPHNEKTVYLSFVKFTLSPLSSTGIYIPVKFNILILNKRIKTQNSRNSANTQSYNFNNIALRKAKIVCNFGLSECNRVNKADCLYKYDLHTFDSNSSVYFMFVL